MKMTTLKNGFTVEPIPKVSSGIAGLDLILLGGLPQGRTTLISGGPGTGKTVVGVEFLYRGALAGEPGVFVTFEETEDEVRRNAQALGWDLRALEESGKLIIMQAEVPIDLILSGEFNIDGLIAIVRGQIKSIGAKRVVIDAVDRLLELFTDPMLRRNQLHTLHRWLREEDVTTLMTAKHLDKGTNFYPLLDYLLDCVIFLDQRVIGQVMTRRMRVLKYRGSGFFSNEYPYLISNQGIELMPISTTKLHQVALGPAFSTGNSHLDKLLGGGIRQAASVVIAGSSGTGKTTLATSIAVAACARGERVLYLSFEESQQALIETMLSPGIDLRPALEAGLLKILTAIPESVGVEEHLLTISKAVESFKPDFLILEAISATGRLGSQQAAFDLLVRLIDLCKARGITSIFTNQTHTTLREYASNIEHISGIGISSLIDTLLLLEQGWGPDSYERRLVVIKSRGSRHSHYFHTFAITDQGIVVRERPSFEAPETDRSGER
jgi:circadian clock protein KaiC